MKNKIICFSMGLSEADMEKGKASFYERHQEAPALEIIVITESMLGLNVGDVLQSVIEHPGEQQRQENALMPDSSKYRVVIVLAQEREQVLQIMKSFKSVLPDPQNVIFAVITETALTWTFSEYIEHLGKEHEYMTTRKS